MSEVIRLEPSRRCDTTIASTRHRCDLEGRLTVTLPAALLRKFGVGRDAKARALRALEDAGLARVERTNGRAARITLGKADRGGKG